MRERSGRGSASGVGDTSALAAALPRLGEGTREGGDLAVEARDGDETQTLPPNMYDVDRILAKTPLLRNDNAFHDTLNSERGGSLVHKCSRVRFNMVTATRPRVHHVYRYKIPWAMPRPSHLTQTRSMIKRSCTLANDKAMTISVPICQARHVCLSEYMKGLEAAFGC